MVGTGRLKQWDIILIKTNWTFKYNEARHRELSQAALITKRWSNGAWNVAPGQGQVQPGRSVQWYCSKQNKLPGNCTSVSSPDLQIKKALGIFTLKTLGAYSMMAVDRWGGQKEDKVTETGVTPCMAPGKGWPASLYSLSFLHIKFRRQIWNGNKISDTFDYRCCC